MSYIDQVLASGPASLWPLNEASGTVAKDVTGGRNGTYQATYTLNSTSLLPGSGFGSLSLPGSPPGGTGGWVQSVDAAVFSSHAGASGVMSLEAVVNVNLVTYTAFLVTKYAPFNFEFYWYVDVTGFIALNMLPAGGGSNVAAAATAAGAIASGTTHHLACTYDRAAAQIHHWVDGVLIPNASSSFVGTTADTTATLNIGHTATSTDGNRLQGNLAMIAYYNKVLSDNEIKAHAQEFRRGGVSLGHGGYGG